MNATVLAHSQTIQVQNVNSGNTFLPYTGLDITAGQMAEVLSLDGIQTWNTPLGRTLVAENPRLANDYYRGAGGGPITHSGSVSGVVATSTTQATTYFATTFLHTLAPTTLVSATFGHPQLSVTANFGVVEPKYNATTETGLSNLIHYLTPGVQPFSLVSSSDAAAIWGGQADFAIETPTSTTYVAPTESTMQAAVSDMAPQADGTLVPDPRGGPVNGTQAYPLTYVEYAIAPTQPLMTATCAPRTQSQQDLAAWLSYITGAGQTSLPAGMAPLTSALQAQAQAAIAKVGEATPACAGATVSATRTTSTTSSGSGSGSAGTAGGSATGSQSTVQGASSTPGSTASGSGTAASGQSGGSGGSGSSGRFSSSHESSSGSTSGGTGGGTASSTPGGREKSAPSALNPGSALVGFTAAEGTNWLLPAVGMLLLFLLLPGLVLLAAGRSPRQSLAKVGRWLRWGGRRPPVGPS